ncbi:MAG: serine protease Do [Verrucomicrobiales bacterium]|jgi:serine protease Do
MKTLRFLLSISLATSAFAETVKDREGAIRGDKAKMENNDRWIYQDVDAGFAEAKRTGKPLMVVLRCVPCLACMGIDTEVLTENAELTPLMDQFVLVRVINANALDLSKFQFDYDLSFSVLFFNADGTVYGRYGSWEHQHDPQNAATATFKQALEGALQIHDQFPDVLHALEGKQGRPSRFKTAVDMPGLSEKYKLDLNWNGKVVQSCVHCHQLGDAQRLDLRSQGKPLPLNLIYPFPAPETIGIHFEEEAALTIASVDSGSPAEKAGLAKGDEVFSVNGQVVISAADVSWALHNLPDISRPLDISVQSGDVKNAVEVSLPQNWRENADISRRVGSWPMRAMAFGGAFFVELPDEDRERLGLADDQLALLAKHVGQYGKHAAAKREGWKNGDILMEIDGSDERFTESQLLGRFIREHKPGEKIPATALRGNQRVKLKIPIQ